MTKPTEPGNPLLSRQLVFRLQKTSGNQAVRRILERQGGPPFEKRKLVPFAEAAGPHQTSPGWRARLSRLFARGQPNR